MANELSDNELIWLFIDGASSPDESDMLFTALHGNAELQQDFQNAITLRTALEHSRERAVVTPLLTNRVMSAAGIAVTGGAILGGATTSGAWWNATRDVVSAWAGKALVPAASAVLASVITFFVMQENNQAPLALNSSNHIHETFSVGDTSPLPAISTVMQSAQQQPVAPERVVTKYVYMQQPNTNTTTGTIANNVPPTEQPDSPVTTNITARSAQDAPENVLLTSAQSIGGMFAPSPELQPMQQIDITNQPVAEKESQYLVSFRGISGITMYPTRDLSSNATMFNNITGMVTYQLAKNHAVGLEVGTEAFPMYAISKLESGALQYNQRPQLTFAGATYQYTGNTLEEFTSLKPVLRGFIGGTDFGPMLKGVVGVQYEPNNSVVMGTGMETTSLVYTQRGDWFATHKLSFTYWVGFRI